VLPKGVAWVVLGFVAAVSHVRLEDHGSGTAEQLTPVGDVEGCGCTCLPA